MEFLTEFALRSAPGMWALVGAILVAITTRYVIHKHTKISKIVDTTLLLTQRLQELISIRYEMNKIYREQTEDQEDNSGSLNPDALNWYRQYFDHLLNEYRFYRRGFVEKDDFVQWLKWARFNYERGWPLCGRHIQASLELVA
jgi:hypothetical protein